MYYFLSQYEGINLYIDLYLIICLLPQIYNIFHLNELFFHLFALMLALSFLYNSYNADALLMPILNQILMILLFYCLDALIYSENLTYKIHIQNYKQNTKNKNKKIDFILFVLFKTTNNKQFEF